MVYYILEFQSFVSANLVYLIPFTDILKISAFVMCAEISSSTQRSSWVFYNEHRRRVRVAHQRYPKSLDTMVDMHSSGNITHFHTLWSFDPICMT